MLPRPHRLRRGSEFSLTTRSGAKSSAGRVVAYVHRVEEGPARVGMIVGRSVGNSVVRHRVTRRIRAVMAEVLNELPADVWVVLRALPGADGDRQLSSDVRTAVERALARSGSS